MALALAVWHQDPATPGLLSGKPRPDWLLRQCTEIYTRIRAHRNHRSVERVMPGATLMAASMLGYLLGAPQEDVDQVVADITAPPPPVRKTKALKADPKPNPGRSQWAHRQAPHHPQQRRRSSTTSFAIRLWLWPPHHPARLPVPPVPVDRARGVHSYGQTC